MKNDNLKYGNILLQMIRAARALFPPGRNWIARIESMKDRDLGRLLSNRQNLKHERKKILFYSMIPWAQGCVEHMSSVALNLRGHEVFSIICSGALPDCEMHYYDFDRPDCRNCLEGALRFTNAFGITPILSSDLIAVEDEVEANNIVNGLSFDELLLLEYNGVPVGKIARFHINVFYQNFILNLDETQIEQFKTFCKTAILLTKQSTRVLDEVKPDIVIVSNGKAFTYRPLFHAARHREIRVVTWEEHAFDNTMKFVFNHNCFAGEIHLEEPWKEEKDRQLTPDQAGNVEEYFVKWKRAEITPFPYYDSPNQRVTREELGIKPGTSLIACFPNMCRDTAAIDRDIGFKNMIDWLLKTVEFAYNRPELSFVIRAHPAEKKLPPQYAKYNRLFVCDEVKKHFSPLPENVFLFEGDSPISSYSLMDMADVVVVYSSTIGLECALNGRLACVAGDVHFRNKGFTKDISTPNQLWEFLDKGPDYQRNISEQQIQFAQRYAYLWRFRNPVKVPFYNPDGCELSLPGFGVLAPGGDSSIERLCHCILTGDPFIDINF